MTPRVELAPVRAADHDDFFAMFEPYHRELDAYDPYPGGPEPFDLEAYRAALLADLDARDLDWILVEGERAGFSMVRLLPDFPDDTREVASIAEFYVLPSHRRTGAGRAAAELLLARYRVRGVHLVEAGVLRDNEPARAFWARLGFEVQSVMTARRP